MHHPLLHHAHSSHLHPRHTRHHAHHPLRPSGRAHLRLLPLRLLIRWLCLLGLVLRLHSLHALHMLGYELLSLLGA